MSKTFGKAWWIPVLIAILLLAHNYWGFRIPRVIHPDETWTMDMIIKTPSRLLYSILTEDNHPPLYYFLLKIWSAIAGTAVPRLRILSFLFSSITLFFIAVFYRYYRRDEIIFVLGLMATNPLFTYYSATVRPYSLLVLLASIVTVSVLNLRQLNSRINTGENLSRAKDLSSQRSWLITYYLSAFFLGITHYFGTLYVWLIVIVNFFTPIRKVETKLWRSVVLMLLTIIWPILQIAFGTLDQQKESNSWVNVVPFISTTNNFLSGTFPLLMISKSVPQLSFGVALALLLLLLIIRRQANHPVLLAAYRHGKPTSLLSLDPIFLGLICLLVLAFGCMADLVLPFTTPYYFLVCLPAVAVLFGKAVVSCYQDKFKMGLCLSAFVAITALQILLAQQRLATP